MPSQITIHLNDKAEGWAIRQNALQLFEQIEHSKNKRFVVDFKGIEGVNRSFVQEYLNRKLQLKNKVVTETNINKNVKVIFDIVENPQNKQVLNVNKWAVTEMPC